jgi:hypothetical protein
MLVICSNHKTRTGESREYSTASNIGESVPEQDARQLFEGRRHIRALITGKEVSRDGRLLHDFPFNSTLVEGPDFQLKGMTSKGGLYLPAIKRYCGKFYTALEPEGLNLVANPRHHILIISGLYGILTPAELIQCYSCNVTDHQDIYKRWREDDRLTNVLVAYIKRHNIARVFDLMAVDAYRNLVSWEMVRDATKRNVLHCFSRQYAGDALLPSLGTLARQLLNESDDALLSIRIRDSRKIPDDEIVFQPFHIPDSPDIAHEMKRQEVRLTTADNIGRMRRNVIKILKCVPHADNAYGFSDLINNLRQHHHESGITDHIWHFENQRNLVEYDGYDLYGRELQEVESHYNAILDWARKKNYVDKVFLE